MCCLERTCFVVVYALMQAEACVAELVYLICVFDIVTNLVFDDSGRVDEARIFWVVCLDRIKERKFITVLETDFGCHQLLEYHVQYSQI